MLETVGKDFLSELKNGETGELVCSDLCLLTFHGITKPGTAPSLMGP